MDIEKFCAARPYLYHLTDERNLPIIKKDATLYSTVSLAKMVYSGKQLRDFIRGRRSDHEQLVIKGKPIMIRDQQPISLIVLERSLTDGWSSEDFIEHLNKRVFFWPSEGRLWKHYDRYQAEKPVILRVSSEDLLECNPSPLFCRLNSGATRCSSHWDGNAPERGKHTFLPANLYQQTPGTVAEVTFEGECLLPDNVEIARSPDGPWRSW